MVAQKLCQFFGSQFSPSQFIAELLCMNESFARSRGRAGPTLLSGLAISPSPAGGLRHLVWFPCRTKVDVLVQSHLDTGALGILGTWRILLWNVATEIYLEADKEEGNSSCSSLFALFRCRCLGPLQGIMTRA